MTAIGRKAASGPLYEIAAALAFAIREAVRLEAERSPLPVAPSRANVVAMKPKPEAQVA